MSLNAVQIVSIVIAAVILIILMSICVYGICDTRRKTQGLAVYDIPPEKIRAQMRFNAKQKR